MPESTPRPVERDPKTEATRAATERVFRELERDNPQAFFDQLSDDVHWIITGTNPLAGQYRGWREYFDRVYSRVVSALRTPPKVTVRRIFADGDLAAVEWHGSAVSIADKPYENDFCWVLRFGEGKIIEVTAYFDDQAVRDLFVTTAQ